MSLNLGIISSSYKAAAPSANLLLDDYPGAVAAYSFRKLRSAYTGFCCQTYDTTNGFVNVGFVNNYVDLTMLQNLGSNLFITNWYDQSGNGNNLFRFQLQGGIIKVAGVIQTINGKVSLLYSNTQNGNSNSNSINLKNGFSNFTTGRINTTTNQTYLFSKGSNDIVLVAVQNSNQWGIARDNVAAIAFKNNDAPITFTLFTSYYDGLNGAIKTNGTIQATGTYSNATTPNNAELSVPYNNNTGILNNSNITESIFYQSTQLANQSGIEANINSFYTIY